MWPVGAGQIHTSRHAGGMASLAMRPSTSTSSTRSPSASTYSKPRPRPRRRIPGEPGSERFRRGTVAVYPSPIAAKVPGRVCDRGHARLADGYTLAMVKLTAARHATLLLDYDP